MLSIILISCVLVAVTVVIHVAGITVLLIVLRRWNAFSLAKHFWQIALLLLIIAGGEIFFHLMEIAVWGLFYLRWGHMPDAESAFYFAGTTYTTIGFGDLVLAKPWRILAPIEGLTGILMCGLSASFFFAAVHYVYHVRDKPGEVQGS